MVNHGIPLIFVLTALIFIMIKSIAAQWIGVQCSFQAQHRFRQKTKIVISISKNGPLSHVRDKKEAI